MAEPTKIYITRNVEDFSGSPADGEIMRWYAAGPYWRPDTLDFDELGQVGVSGPSNGQYLRYNGSNWVNVAKPSYLLDNLVDVDITSPADKALLVYEQSSGSWKDGAIDLDDLDDVSASGAADGWGLYYNSGTGQWEAGVATSGSVAAQLLHIFNEDVGGSGSNFSTNYDFVANTLRVTWNGVRQSNTHFSEKAGLDGFTTQFWVESGDTLTVDYARPTSGSVGSVGNANAVTIQGRNVSAQAPTDGQALVWDSGSSAWVPDNVAGESSGNYYTSFDPSCPPESPGNWCDEFDDESVDSVWITWDYNSVLTVAENEVGLVLTNDASNPGSDVAGVLRPLPQGDWTCVVKLTMTGSQTCAAGIVFTNGSTGDAKNYQQAYYYISGNTEVHAIYFATTTSATRGDGNAVLDDVHDYRWDFLRVRKVGSAYSWEFSKDGIMWYKNASYAFTDFTPSFIGLFTNDESGSLDTHATFDFFRLTSGSVGKHEPCYGRARRHYYD